MSDHEYRMQKAVVTAVRDPQWGLWRNAWRKTIVNLLAVEAANRIDVLSTDVSNDWDQLDDHRFLSSLIKNTTQVQDFCVTNLLAISTSGATVRSSPVATGGSSKDIINYHLQSAGFSERNGKHLKELLRQVADSLIPDHISQFAFRTVLTSEFWTAVGHKLAANVYKQNKAGTYQPDWLILNQLLLAEWLFVCQF